MTRVEKEIISAALLEFAHNHESEATEAHEKKQFAAERSARFKANEARAILTYWEEVALMPCGSIRI